MNRLIYKRSNNSKLEKGIMTKITGTYEGSFGRFCAFIVTCPCEPVSFSCSLYALLLSARHRPAHATGTDDGDIVLRGSAQITF